MRPKAFSSRALKADVEIAAGIGQSRSGLAVSHVMQDGKSQTNPPAEAQQASQAQLGAASVHLGRAIGPAPRRAPNPPGGPPMSPRDVSPIATVADPSQVRPSVLGDMAVSHGSQPVFGATTAQSNLNGDQLLGAPIGFSAGSVSRERIVLLSIAFVSVAVATMLYVQFFVPLITSALVGASTCTFFMLMHDRAKKSAEIARLAIELARQRDARPLRLEPSEPVMHRSAPVEQNASRSVTQAAAQSGNNGSDRAIDAVTAAVDRAVATRRQDQRAVADAQSPSFQSHNLPGDPRWEPVTRSGPPGAPDVRASVDGRVPLDDRASSDLSRRRENDRQSLEPRGLDLGAVEQKHADQRTRPITSSQSIVGGMSSDVARDQWAFRPRDAFREPNGEPQRQGGMPSVLNAQPQAARGMAPLSDVSTIETDLALVQRKIKALADEVNGAEVAKAAERSAAIVGSVAARRSSNVDGMPAASEFNLQSIDASIGALKSAAATMRGEPSATVPAVVPPQAPALPSFGEFFIPATAERIAASVPMDPPFEAPSEPALFPSIEAFMPAAIVADDAPSARGPTLPLAPLSANPDAQNQDVQNQNVQNSDDELELALTLPSLMALQPEPQPVDPKIAAITRAIENGRMDVMLSPIVGLMTHEVTHYDVKVLLKTDNGGYFDDPAQDLLLDGSDVLALFDTARLTRAAALARRLDARGKTGALLSEVTGPSLTNGGFLESFARIYEERDRIAGQLVLTFRQADTERFTPSAWQALSDMHAFGFRFALERLEHLSVDFAVLAQRGFALVKVDAGVLLSGMPSSDRFIPSEEVCRRIAGAGLTLIADSVDDDNTRARLFGFGVLFGQGQLFGGARTVSVDPSAHAAALGSRSPAAA